MSRIKIVFLFLLVFGNLYAQDSIKKITIITFENRLFDFGSVKEDGGLVEHGFKFTNSGSDTLILSNVHATCGCTTPEWPKEPILPGANGIIKVTYNPLHRPGKFNKSIFVSANTEPATVNLTISGDVTPKPRTIRDDFPITMGNLWLTTNHKAMQDIANDQTKTDTLYVYNNWYKTMKIYADYIPENLKVKFSTDKIKPNSKAYLVITYDASKKKDWGLLYDKLEIKTNDSLEPVKTLNISANIIENFSKLTAEQKKNAPELKLSSNIVDFGVKKVGDVFTVDLELENTGKSDLILRKNTTLCACLIATPEDEVIKPGQKTKLSIKVDLKNRPGKFSKKIELIFNDPASPSVSITLKGVVEKN